MDLLIKMEKKVSSKILFIFVEEVQHQINITKASPQEHEMIRQDVEDDGESKNLFHKIIFIDSVSENTEHSNSGLERLLDPIYRSTYF